MELTKHVHACVTIDKGDSHLLIDPGTLTPDAADLVADSDVVLISHEHADHFDEELLAAALADRPEFTVYGPAAVVSRWEARQGQIVAVAEGDRFSVGGLDITVHGDLHASIHADIPQVANVGYLVDGSLYHPGDAYHVPPTPVATLLLPTSGPWTKLGEAADYVRAVDPRQVIQIHEMLLSDLGQQFAAHLLGPEVLTKVPLTIVAPGDSLSV